ncbi:autotransporter outer membrane beta-barrel domain-containing protein [Ereboglobus luteus]|uniref:Autotransporter domain-containing protein n=1 Tax=Ereboglobus luteus TaxID=1796921 RepID=A0A2U8E261_9BACT|nr:autotransporter outer membrane beta-barrel domain-containing protein [Ereboglobus luteus]AWI08612.1 hypothetical protein CKA38_04485 [Ereboglobus luteus]
MQNQTYGIAWRSICVRKRNIFFVIPLLAVLTLSVSAQPVSIPNGTSYGSYSIDSGGDYTLSGTRIATDQGSAGIWFNGPAANLTIETDAYVRGGNAGVSMTGGSTLINMGTISGTRNYISNNEGAVVGRGAVTITNKSTGVISSTNRGIAVDGGTAIITNDEGGLIQGGYRGIQLNAGGEITNSGSIIAKSNHGIETNYVSVLVTNSTSGLIQGNADGLHMGAGGTVANSGTINGGSRGLYSGSIAKVTNETGARIEGRTSGVVLDKGGEMENRGTISGTTDYAVRINSGEGRVTNYEGATINGGVYAGGTTAVVNNGNIAGNRGVYLSSNSTLSGTGAIDVSGIALTAENGISHTNGADNLLRGGAMGVSFLGGGTLTNSGTVIGTNGTGFQAQGSVLVTNTNNAIIQGGQRGATLNAGGTVANSGTIIGTSDHGIYAGGGATITNDENSLIQGGAAGIVLVSGGTISNEGTIQGSANYGVSVGAGSAKVTNHASGTIIGGINAAGAVEVINDGAIIGNRGVYLSAASSLSGTGSIDVSGTALTIASTGVHTNAAGLRIKGGDTGVHFEGSGSLGNAGVIEGTAGTGVSAIGLVSITNESAASITGGARGVSLNQGGTVANSGTIIGTNDHGIYAGGAATITNDSDSLIKGGGNGVELAAGGTVTNSGSLIGANLAIHGGGNGGATIITNTDDGLIQGDFRGIQLDRGGEITNSGSIVGKGNHGIEINYVSVLVTNSASGLIQGAADGLNMGAGGTVANSGTIISANALGVYANAAALITNDEHGLIQGGYRGVQLNAGGEITNSGSIVGQSNHGIETNYVAVLVTNSTGGVIQGNADGLHMGAGGTVANSGTIIGANLGFYSGATVILGNNENGLIQGGDYGIYVDSGAADDSGTVSNAGVIKGDSGIGIQSNDGTIFISNTTTGFIQGHDFGVFIKGGTVTNSGTIEGVGYSGIQSSIADTHIINEETGLVKGVTFGIFMNGGTLANSGTIKGTGADGKGAESSHSVRITNTGLIEGVETGVYLLAGGTVTNDGVITGGTGYGVVVNVNAAEITNSATAIINEGVYAGGTTRVINDGAILGHKGVHLAAASSLTGTGYVNVTGTALIAEDAVAHTNDTMNLLHGDIVGVHFLGSGTLTNSGTIEGASDTGVYAAGQVLVTNTTGGIITGPVYAINLAADAANEVRLWNSGTLAGNLGIAGTNSRLTLISNDTLNAQRYADAVTGSTTFTGTLVKQGAGTWIIDTAPGAGMEQAATLVQSGTLVVDWDAHQLNAANNAEIGIDAGATLQISTTSNATTTLTNPLAGAGYVDLHSTATDPGATFGLQPFSPSALGFTGTVGVRGDSQLTYFRFDDDAENALADATLRLGQNSETTLDKDRAIGGFDLFSGMFFVSATTTGTTVEPHTLTVTGTLHGTSGTIGVHTDVLGGLDLPKPPGTGGLTGHIFDVDALNDSALNSKVIVSATESTIIGGASFDLVDSNTNALGQNSTVDFYNAAGDTIVGKTHYGYKATHASGTGIVLDYGLTEIESTHTDLLVEIDPTGSYDKTLSAKLSGAGAGFAFSGTEQITLAQQATYTGQTQLINSATLKAGVANVIASSTKVTINASTAFDLGGYDQTLQNVSGAGDIHLGDKTLAIANTETALEFSGTIDGAGNVTLTDDSEWTLTANNTYTGTTTIGAGAHLQLGTGAGGSTTGMIADASYVDNSGTLTINRSDDIVYGGAVTGSGILVQRGTGTTTLTGANNIAGGIVVEQGALQIGRDDTSGWDGGVIAANVSVADTTTLIFNRSDLVTYDGVISGAGNVSTIGGGTVALTKAQTYTGETRIGANSTLRTGATNAIQTSSRVFLDGALDLHDHAQQIKNLTGNAGRIHYSINNGIATTYTNLTISGTLEGTTTSHINVDLANKNTDMLIVQGATSLATGTHYVEFTQTNLTPIDDATRTYALKVVDYVNGDPVFTSNIVESGMFTFQLYKGDGGLIMPDETAFYLSGGDAFSRAGDAILFTAGVMGPSWHFDLDSVHKRLGDIYAHRDRDIKNEDEGSVWMRVNNYRLNASSALGGSAFEQDSYGVTAGADKLLRRENATLALGGFIGISRHDRTFDDARNQYGDGNSNTVGAGLYALWMNEQNWFIDAVLRFDRTSNELNARGVDGFVSRGKYTNLTQGASVEFGRRLVRPSIQTSSGKLLTFWTEPLAQVAVAWINGADYTVSNGVSRDLEVQVGDSDAWQYRLQVRTGANYGQWMPYLKFGAVKTDTNGGEVTVDDREYQPWFDGWRTELGLGVAYQINENGQLYFDYEYNKAQRYERPWAVNLGYRRAW